MRRYSSTKQNRSLKKSYVNVIIKLFAMSYLLFCIGFLITAPTTAYFNDVENASVAVSVAGDSNNEDEEWKDPKESDEKSGNGPDGSQPSEIEDKNNEVLSTEESEKSAVKETEGKTNNPENSGSAAPSEKTDREEETTNQSQDTEESIKTANDDKEENENGEVQSNTSETVEKKSDVNAESNSDLR